MKVLRIAEMVSSIFRPIAFAGESSKSLLQSPQLLRLIKWTLFRRPYEKWPSRCQQSAGAGQQDNKTTEQRRARSRAGSTKHGARSTEHGAGSQELRATPEI